MRKVSFSIALLLALLAADSDSATVPSSARSERAIARVRPALELALHAKGLGYGEPIFIRIFKESSELELWVQAEDRFALFRTYKVCYYSGDLGPKLRIGGRTGDALMVHGSCVSIGCYAMTDRSIEEIYALAAAALRNGQTFFQVHVFPFRLTAEKLFRHKESRWYGFWQNLKEGYDLFENTGRPPKVSVKNKRYVFEAR
jgi:murein L,D-transpeptidase YafK